jgi:hypothetical protein
MMVWVLELNPSKQFYLNLGAIPFDKKSIDMNGQTLYEIAMGWADLSILIKD